MNLNSVLVEHAVSFFHDSVSLDGGLEPVQSDTYYYYYYPLLMASFALSPARSCLSS